MLLQSITAEQFTASVCALSAEIHSAGLAHNLLGDASQDRGEIFLADSHIPVPRVSTILAWSSAFSIGPASGYYRRLTRSSPPSFIPFDLLDGGFVLPFLPKIRHGEDTTISLSRSSGAHKKSVLGDISWGSVYIADSSTGNLIEELEHGQIPISEWLTHKVSNHDRSLLPPMWADIDDGWQFGIDQHITGLTCTPRLPVEMLAKYGIPWPRFFRPQWHLRRVLFRFHSILSVKEWAKQFSSSIHDWSPSRMDEDSKLLLEEISKAKLRMEEKALDKRGIKPGTKKAMLLSQLDRFDEVANRFDLGSFGSDSE